MSYTWDGCVVVVGYGVLLFILFLSHVGTARIGGDKRLSSYENELSLPWKPDKDISIP